MLMLRENEIALRKLSSGTS